MRSFFSFFLKDRTIIKFKKEFNSLYTDDQGQPINQITRSHFHLALKPPQGKGVVITDGLFTDSPNSNKFSSTNLGPGTVIDINSPTEQSNISLNKRIGMHYKMEAMRRWIIVI